MICMGPVVTAMTTAALTIACIMLVTWAASVALHNAAIVDVVWGLGFVAVAWAVHLRLHTAGTPAWLLIGLVSLWGVRLATHLGMRAWGHPEDYRYQAMRRRAGPGFWWKSLFKVFGLQGVLMWIVSLPLQLGQIGSRRPLGWLGWLGLALFAVGFAFESIGDAQLRRFRAEPSNAGTVMNRGLWRYTRHPNYFGDACVWWGLGAIAAQSGVGAWGLVGSAVMTILLRRVSGVTHLERGLRKRRAGYDEYIATTSPFIPRPPRRAHPDRAGR